MASLGDQGNLDKLDEKMSSDGNSTVAAGHKSPRSDSSVMNFSGVSLAPEALTAALKFAEEVPEYEGKSLRLYIEGKGCDGFNYGVTFDDATATDIRFEQGSGVVLVLDKEVLPYVEGAVIQWVDDERGRGFLVENPLHRKFRGKFFKRSSWSKWAEDRTRAVEEFFHLGPDTLHGGSVESASSTSDVQTDN